MSGAMHYFRTLPEQWRDRLSKLKAAGFNTVETYCCWNLHEPREGEYCFEGMLDVERFIETASEEGLYVIVRPGPYICSEWDLGGLPAWLLRNDGIQLRSCQPEYFDRAERYIRRLMSYITPHLQTRGGNVIMVAAENEYGSCSNSREYMDKWDGRQFIDSLQLTKEKSVLEIGVGTGRLAVRVAPECREFFGIDISQKTVKRAKENLKKQTNVTLVCGDFMSYEFGRKFDIIYSSLTFMHIKDKQAAINKVKTLLNIGGRFVLSIDKSQSDTIDYGTRKIKIYPDNKEDIVKYITQSGMSLIKIFETEFAEIFAAAKQN